MELIAQQTACGGPCCARNGISGECAGRHGASAQMLYTLEPAATAADADDGFEDVEEREDVDCILAQREEEIAALLEAPIEELLLAIPPPRVEHRIRKATR